MLTKLRLRQKGKSVSVLHGELAFLELLLALPNLKSVFKSARCAHGGDDYLPSLRAAYGRRPSLGQVTVESRHRDVTDL
jgi:hypothetical protein